MEAVDISEAEILDALRATLGNADLGPRDAFTRGEIGAAMGWGLPRTSSHLIALKHQGLVEVVKVKREAVDGRHCMVPGYRFLKRKKAAR